MSGYRLLKIALTSAAVAYNKSRDPEKAKKRQAFESRQSTLRHFVDKYCDLQLESELLVHSYNDYKIGNDKTSFLNCVRGSLEIPTSTRYVPLRSHLSDIGGHHFRQEINFLLKEYKEKYPGVYDAISGEDSRIMALCGKITFESAYRMYEMVYNENCPDSNWERFVLENPDLPKIIEPIDLLKLFISAGDKDGIAYCFGVNKKCNDGTFLSAYEYAKKIMSEYGIYERSDFEKFFGKYSGFRKYRYRIIPYFEGSLQCLSHIEDPFKRVSLAYLALCLMRGGHEKKYYGNDAWFDAYGGKVFEKYDFDNSEFLSYVESTIKKGGILAKEYKGAHTLKSYDIRKFDIEPDEVAVVEHKMSKLGIPGGIKEVVQYLFGSHDECVHLFNETEFNFYARDNIYCLMSYGDHENCADSSKKPEPHYIGKLGSIISDCDTDTSFQPKALTEDEVLGLVEEANSLYEQKVYSKAFYLYSEAAKYGSGEAMGKLGCMYYRGIGTKKNVDLAAGWLEEAVNRLGDDVGSDVYTNLGCCYFNGDGVPVDCAKAEDLWLKAYKIDMKHGVFCVQSTAYKNYQALLTKNRNSRYSLLLSDPNRCKCGSSWRTEVYRDPITRLFTRDKIYNYCAICQRSYKYVESNSPSIELELYESPAVDTAQTTTQTANIATKKEKSCLREMLELVTEGGCLGTMLLWLFVFLIACIIMIPFFLYFEYRALPLWFY